MKSCLERTYVCDCSAWNTGVTRFLLIVVNNVRRYEIRNYVSNERHVNSIDTEPIVNERSIVHC
jgi:hypothetical protein